MRLWQEDEYEGEPERAYAAVEEEGDGGVAVGHVSEEKGEKGVHLKVAMAATGVATAAATCLKSGDISEAVETEIIAATAAAKIPAAAAVTTTAATAAELTNTTATTATATTTVPVKR